MNSTSNAINLPLGRSADNGFTGRSGRRIYRLDGTPGPSPNRDALADDDNSLRYAPLVIGGLIGLPCSANYRETEPAGHHSPPRQTLPADGFQAITTESADDLFLND